MRRKKKSKETFIEKEEHKAKRVFHEAFILTSERFMAVISLWILAVFAHILIFSLFYIEESVFFLISGLILPAYLIISMVHTFHHHHRKTK